MIPEISMPYHKQYLGIPREKGVSWNGILKLGWGGGGGVGGPETRNQKKTTSKNRRHDF